MFSALISIPLRLKASLAILLATLMFVSTVVVPGSSVLYAQSESGQTSEEVTAQRHGETATIT